MIRIIMITTLYEVISKGFQDLLCALDSLWIAPPLPQLRPYAVTDARNAERTALLNTSVTLTLTRAGPQDGQETGLSCPALS
jgi:hypothetical protein